MDIELLDRFLELDVKYSRKLCIAEKPGALHTAVAIIAHSGDSWLCFLVLGLVWFFGSPEWKVLDSTLFFAVLALAIMVTAIKYLFRRQRPAGTWGTLYRRTDPHSFPSGHAARTTLLATLVLILGPAWLGLLLMAWALLVILARVAMGVHYLSDVIAGALIGIFVAMVIGFLIV